MQKNEQANLLSIFAFIFAGIQGLAALLFGLYVISMVVVLVMAALDPKAVNEPGVFLVPGFLILLFGTMCVYGLFNIFLNVKMGRALRGSRLPTQKRVIVTSIFNLCSIVCGGVLIAPFGIAVGIFGIVFAVSDKGKAFLSGRLYSSMLPPAPPVSFEQQTARDAHVWRQ